MAWSSSDQNPTMGPSAAYGGGNYAASLNAVSYNPLGGGSSSTGMAPTMAAASSQPNYAERLNATNPAQPKTTSQALQAVANKPQPAVGTRAAREIQAWGGGGSRFEIAGRAAERGIGKVDNALVDIIQKASEGQPYNVQVFSGYRPGDKRQHGRGNAVDIALVDPYSGEALPNYQSAETFPQYETFAKRAYEIAQRDYPDLAEQFRWGGYFGGGKGKYGATDTMHFDVNSGMGMGGGSWEGGLNPDQQRRVDRMGGGRTQWAGLRPGTTEAPPATMYAGNPFGVGGNDQMAGGNAPPTPRMRPDRTEMAYAPPPEAQAPFDAVLDPSANRRPQPPTPRSRPQRDTLQAPAGGEYVVRRGDNLTKIARQAGVSVQEIARANNIRDPNRINPGQRLVIPGGQAAPRQPAQVDMPTPRMRPERGANVPNPRMRPQQPQAQPAPQPQQRQGGIATEADVQASVADYRQRNIQNGLPEGPDLDAAVQRYERALRQGAGLPQPDSGAADVGRAVSNFRSRALQSGVQPGPVLDEATRRFEEAYRANNAGGQPQAALPPGMNVDGLIREPTAQERALQGNTRLPLPTGNQPMDPMVQQQIRRTPAVITDPLNQPQPRADMGGRTRMASADVQAMPPQVEAPFPPEIMEYYRQNGTISQGQNTQPIMERMMQTENPPAGLTDLPSRFYRPGYGPAPSAPPRNGFQGPPAYTASNGIRFFAIG